MNDASPWSWFSMLSSLIKEPSAGGIFVCLENYSRWLWSTECAELLGEMRNPTGLSHNIIFDHVDKSNHSILNSYFNNILTKKTSFKTRFNITSKTCGQSTLEINCHRFENTEVGPLLIGWLQAPPQQSDSLIPLRIAGIALDASEAIVVMDTQERVLGVNRAYCEITGYSQEEVIGGPVISLLKGHIPVERLIEIREARRKAGKWSGDFTLQRKDGTERTGWCSVRSVFDTDGNETHIVATLIDRTRVVEAEQRIERLVSQDQLTGLPNRQTFLKHIAQACAFLERHENLSALIFMALDQFKFVNAADGYNAGDQLLKTFTQYLSQFIARDCVVARIGSDEFAILLEGLGSNSNTAADQAAHLAQQILDTCNQSNGLFQFSHKVDLSIGITLIRQGVTSPEQILRESALASYDVKNRGGNAYLFFDTELEKAVQHRMKIETGIRRTLNSGGFQLHYQPQVNASGLLTGVEALIRWPLQDGSFCSPVEFIPVAEATGLMPKLGHWVLERACQQLKQWAAHPVLRNVPIAVNVSAIQFNHSDFLSEVQALISEYEIDTSKLKMEITESIFASNVDSIAEKLNSLRDLGIKVALDDFGTGYSSLSYLRNLQFDQLKIDRSFVNKIEFDAKDMAIAKTIVTLAKSIGISVIAEGVESSGQRDLLNEMGCDEIQGYLVAKPMPVVELEMFVLDELLLVPHSKSK